MCSRLTVLRSRRAVEPTSTVYYIGKTPKVKSPACPKFFSVQSLHQGAGSNDARRLSAATADQNSLHRDEFLSRESILAARSMPCKKILRQERDNVRVCNRLPIDGLLAGLIISQLLGSCEKRQNTVLVCGSRSFRASSLLKK